VDSVWVANVITVSRVAFAIAFWVTYGSRAWSVAWIALAAISDALDGRVARAARARHGTPIHAPSVGDWLDPAADKVFVVIVVIAIGFHGSGTWPLIACLAARELVLVPVLVVYTIARGLGGVRSRPLRAQPIGKLATVMQFIALVAVVAPMSGARWPLAIAAGVLGLVAAIEQLAVAFVRPPTYSPRPPRSAQTVPTIAHTLAPHYGALRAIRNRRALEPTALWTEIGTEVERVLDLIERRDHPAAALPAGQLRVIAWNIQRGTHLDAAIAALRTDPELARADVLLLSEVDIGMGRSNNRNVPRELADALGMSYAFAVSYVVLEDDQLENPDGIENTLALAGSAILTRAPILRVANADVPALRDKFGSSEKRLGRKRAIVAELATASGPIVVAQAHLDSTASSAQRSRQLSAVLDAADVLDARRLLLGGDFNTTTYDYGSILGLARDVLHKLVVTGFDRTIDNYMTPELVYERPIFELLAARGLTIDGFNDRAHGTLRYDFSEPYTLAKVQEAVGGFVTRWLVRRLRSRGGVVEARVDWFAGRGLVPLAASVPRPRPRASDHDPIAVEVQL
jgi:endonuclease/exonuclease/phosphatase family metal-dependent hydrolase/phosphatidylglycerophosphate synthase